MTQASISATAWAATGRLLVYPEIYGETGGRRVGAPAVDCRYIRQAPQLFSRAMNGSLDESIKLDEL